MKELSLHVLDILQNAREAGATLVHLTVEENLDEDRFSLEVRDNGRGMGEETVKRLKDPFFTTRRTRHVGLGLPLLAAAAERCNGSLAVESAPGQGTCVSAVFQWSHLDRAPLGDMAGTLMSFLLGEPFCDLVYVHRRGRNDYSLDTREVRRELHPVEITHPAAREWLAGTLSQAEEALGLPAAGISGTPSGGKEV